MEPTLPTIHTLIEDVERLFEGHEVSDEAVTKLGQMVADTVRDRLAEPLRNEERTPLRISNVGKPARQLWYDLYGDHEVGSLSPQTRFKFLYGDLIELICLFLAREAGHTVEREQEEIEVNGVLGHIDAVIDGVVVDVKSANANSFKRFEGKLDSDDPFSYIEQLAGYSSGLGGLDGAFWVIDKELGKQKLLEVSREDMEIIDVPARIEYLKTALAEGSEIPERCYDDVPEGKSGNTVLPIGCSYCAHKFTCWRDSNNGIGLRTFLYSKGPVHFTNVAKEPNGPMELTF